MFNITVKDYLNRNEHLMYISALIGYYDFEFYSVKIRTSVLERFIYWLEDNDIVDYEIDLTNLSFDFKKEEDYILFKMRFC